MAAIQVKSAEQTLLESVPIQLLTTPQMRGRIRCHKTSYLTVGTTFEAGSTITGTAFPKGARVLFGYLSATGTTSLTLAVAINSIAFLAATAFTSTAVVLIPDAAGSLLVHYPDVDSGGYAPVITSAGATAAAASKITLYLFYVVD